MIRFLSFLALLSAFLALPILLTGCGTAALETAKTVSNEGAGVLQDWAPELKEKCILPMEEAAKAMDKARAEQIAKVCDPAVLGYMGLRSAHILLRGAIVQVATGGDIGQLVVATQKAAAAITTFVQAIMVVSDGGD